MFTIKFRFDVKEVLSFFHRKSTHDLSGIEATTSQLRDSRTDGFGGSHGNLSSLGNNSPLFCKNKKQYLYPHQENRTSSKQGSHPGTEQIKRWEYSLEHLLADRC